MEGHVLSFVEIFNEVQEHQIPSMSLRPRKALKNCHFQRLLKFKVNDDIQLVHYHLKSVSLLQKSMKPTRRGKTRPTLKLQNEKPTLA